MPPARPIGYSAPFLFAQFEVILQDRTVAEAKSGWV